MTTNTEPKLSELTPTELQIVGMLADASIEFNQLPIYHPSDAPEFYTHINALQNIVMSRIAVRAHPSIFPRRSE